MRAVSHGRVHPVSLAAALQRALQQVEPVLAPEHFAIEHIGGRAEHAGGDRARRVCSRSTRRSTELRGREQRSGSWPLSPSRSAMTVASARFELIVPRSPHGRAAERFGIGPASATAITVRSTSAAERHCLGSSTREPARARASAAARPADSAGGPGGAWAAAGRRSAEHAREGRPACSGSRACAASRCRGTARRPI